MSRRFITTLAAVAAFLLLGSHAAMADSGPPHLEPNFNTSGNFTAAETIILMGAIETYKEESGAEEVTFEHPGTTVGCGAAGCHVQGGFLDFIPRLHDNMVLNPDDPDATCGFSVACHPQLEDVHMFYSVTVKTNLPETPDDTEGVAAITALVEFAKNARDRVFELMDGVSNTEGTRVNLAVSGATEDTNLLLPPVRDRVPGDAIPAWFLTMFADDLVDIARQQANALAETNTQLIRNEIYGSQSSAQLIEWMDVDMRALEDALGNPPSTFAAALQGWEGELPENGFTALADALAVRLPGLPQVQDTPDMKVWAGAIGQLQSTRNDSLLTFENLAQNFFDFEDHLALLRALDDVNQANPDNLSPFVGVTRYYTATNAQQRELLTQSFLAPKPAGIETRGFGGGFGLIEGGEEPLDPEPYIAAIETAIAENGPDLGALSVSQAFDEAGESTAVRFNRTLLPTEAELAPEDLDGNGVVDRADYNLVRAAFRQSASALPEADFNGNGRIDAGDLRAIVAAFDCPRGICGE